MFDCSKELLKFYDHEVKLSDNEQKELASYRDANITRLENGLKAELKPLPDKYINQGSYAMDTIIQHKSKDYDIDVGILYGEEKLKDKDGYDISSLDAKKMICEALQDRRFVKEPVVKDNCVRIFYNEGYHIDMPVYKKSTTFFGNEKIELATIDAFLWVSKGGKWEETNPQAVSKWFCDSVINKSPDEINGRQMRRIVRYIKFWAQSNLGRNKPSGFIISKLVDECYSPKKDRDDLSLFDTLNKINSRLVSNKNIEHPIIAGTYISKNKEDAINNMANKINPSLEILADLFQADCTRNTALKKWKIFFINSYFTDIIEEESIIALPIAPVTPSSPVVKKGGERFA